MNEKIQGQIRHVLTAAGPLLIAAGVTDADGADQFVDAALAALGAISTLVGVVWSWRSK